MDNATLQILKDSIGALLRHGLSFAGTWLVAHGALVAGSQDSFVQIGTGIAMAGVAFLWSLWQKSAQRQKVVTAAVVGEVKGEVKEAASEAKGKFNARN